MKFIALDVIRDEQGVFYILELCPALTCGRGQQVMLTIQNMAHLSSKRDNGLMLIQPPQEPLRRDGVLSHFVRDAKSIEAFASRMDELNLPHLPKIPSQIRLISKEEVRQYISDVLLGKQASPHIFWVMYFRDGIHHTETADNFSLLLMKLFKKAKKRVLSFDAYPLSVACEQDKVLFWQLLKLADSPFLVPKELFRFSIYGAEQKTKLSKFIEGLPHKKFIIKPTNANLTSGMIVVPRELLVELIDMFHAFLQKFDVGKIDCADAANIELSIVEPIRKMLCPKYAEQSKHVQLLVDIELKKFVNYWAGVDLVDVMGSERDFFLIEAYIEPMTEAIIPEDESLSEGASTLVQYRAAVASRAFMIRSKFSPKPQLMSLSAKPVYKPGETAGVFNFVSASENFYSFHCTDRGKLLRDYRVPAGERDKESRAQASKAFVETAPWVEKMMRTPVSDFLQEVKEANADNPEVLAYLLLDSVSRLDLETMDFCWRCFQIKPSKELSRCSQCKLAMFCNSTCQKEDWRHHHKAECKQWRQ